MNIKVVHADYGNPAQGADIVRLLNGYALDPMGGGEPLPANTGDHLVQKLAAIPHAISLLCYVDGNAAGLLNAFEGFSTFQCKPLINIHDIAVASDYRGLGISQLMLSELERMATQRGCCKVTLEVLQGNTVAQNAYTKYGFSAYELDPKMGKAMFWQKSL